MELGETCRYPDRVCTYIAGSTSMPAEDTAGADGENDLEVIHRLEKLKKGLSGVATCCGATLKLKPRWNDRSAFPTLDNKFQQRQLLRRYAFGKSSVLRER